MADVRPHRRSRPARRAAEREDEGRHRRQDRADRSPVGDRAAKHRGHQLRQPEVGAATGRCRRSVRRHHRKPGVHYPVLVPNEQGYERARSVGVEEIAVFTAASEAFNQKNINASIDESLARFAPVMARARAGRRARARLRVDRARLPVPGRSAAGRRGARRQGAARDGLLRGFAGRHDRRRHAAARRARC